MNREETITRNAERDNSLSCKLDPYAQAPCFVNGASRFTKGGYGANAGEPVLTARQIEPSLTRFN